jgi:5,10-methenyltetrahydrofolate synthetase
MAPSILASRSSRPAPGYHGGVSESAERKAELRRTVLARRDALDPETRAASSIRIFSRIAALPAFRRARVVLAYSAFGSEPATGPFLATVLAGGLTLVLPRVNRTTRMLDLYRVTDLATGLRPGVWGIREPDPTVCAAAALGDVDFVLVPGVAFDSHGGRLGYGAGYYDRLLRGAAAGTPLVAAAFDVQLVDAIPMDAHDRRVDSVVTESRVYAAAGTPGPGSTA